MTLYEERFYYPLLKYTENQSSYTITESSPYDHLAPYLITQAKLDRGHNARRIDISSPMNAPVASILSLTQDPKENGKTYGSSSQWNRPRDEPKSSLNASNLFLHRIFRNALKE